MFMRLLLNMISIFGDYLLTLKPNHKQSYEHQIRNTINKNSKGTGKEQKFVRILRILLKQTDNLRVTFKTTAHLRKAMCKPR